MAQFKTYQSRISSLRRDAYAKGPEGASLFDNNAWRLLAIAQKDAWKEFNDEVRRIRTTLSGIRVRTSQRK